MSTGLFTLAAGGSIARSAARVDPVGGGTFNAVRNAAQLGVKEITETVPAGWTLTDIDCTGDTSGLVIGRYDSSTPPASSSE